MLRRITIAALLLTSQMIVAQAQAGSECRATLNDDIIVTPKSVQIVGASGNLKILPDGSVTRNDRKLSLNTEQRNRAIKYQQTIRQDLPWVKKEALSHLASARQSLDKVIVDTMGKESNIRNRLSQLESGLNKQIDKVIETRANGFAFSAQAVKQVESEGRKLLEQSLGGILQDSINEMSRKKSDQNGDGKHMIMSLLGGLGGAQNGFDAELKKQEQELKRLKEKVCSRASNLEQQRVALMNSIK
ncbi:conserved hypothetical protein; putative exported protein [Xenorhabdus nematophila ATCC 19061]|uniref:DUF2884 family protein n=1 Tax=Xenorhabdus nematophila (strain ATCC 19061 / DSM 3370 / CCUG 14189 / LMG 1036 / NCIMB 9965 / AN6) TaxID=406817 RepID=D3VKR7_XENNA|nr:DUF2884 domain-containing protein [Xenorhabdus nematophila]CBJ91175.1 conserved hypothetical protein; putative exported protein [Xenorhabdus nematophila ATCC 19061]CEK23994.1 conserved hypothetical protein; putative exported protein [Xenorhabdus nematophila AN6/1]